MARKQTNMPPKTGRRHAITANDDAEFLRKVRMAYAKDVQADFHNIEPGREDMRFVLGDQWDENVKTRRESAKKPTLTINRLPAFIGQYLGAFLQSDTTIKLNPTRGGTKTVAEIRQGLVRTIMRTGYAKLAKAEAAKSQYICGVGNFALEVIDSEYDVFTRDMRLKPLEDPFQVVWDRGSYEPTGADAQRCYVFEYMTRDDFNLAYPGHENDGGWYSDEADASTMTAHGWEVEDMVRVCLFWQMHREDVVLALESDSGDVIDVTDMTDEEIALTVAVDEDGAPIMRETVKPYATCHVITAQSILEGPYRLDIPRVPVFRCEGWKLTEGPVQYRWGFVRNAKDPQRVHNFWRSIMAEELMKSPAAKWLIDEAGAKNGLADKFRRAHRSGDNIYTWDSQADGAKPEFLPPPPVNQAVLTEAEMSVRDIRDVTNKHEASLGITSNEVSGKAINARQRVSELGDTIYSENFNMALAECGRVINELIPVIYDTERTVKITGEDDQEILQGINGDFDDATPDITKGKYAMTYSTGPSYATKRQESVDIILTLMNTMPQVGNIVADILVENMDIPGGDQIAERLALMLPDGMIDPERLTGRRKERYEAMQKSKAEQQAVQEQMQEVQFGLAVQKASAEIAELVARALKQEVGAMKDASEVGVQAAKVENDEDLTGIKAAEAGLKMIGPDVDMVKTGLQMAATVAAEKEARQQAAQPQPSNQQDSGE